jgi:hypothetical protein
MAFGQGLITLPTITGSHSDFPVLLTNGCFAANAIDGGVLSLANGGGSARFYTDDTKATRLACEIVEFVVGGSPSIQAWVKIPSAFTGATIYVEEDSVETSQPAVSAAYGRNAVWDDYELVLPGALTDSTGNHGTLSAVGSPSIITGAPTGPAIRFSSSSDYLHTNLTSLTSNDDFTVSLWVAEHGGGDATLFGIADTSSPYGNFSIKWDKDVSVDRVDMFTFARSVSASNESLGQQTGPAQGDYVFTSVSVDSSTGTTGYIKSSFGTTIGTTNSRINLPTASLDRISLNRLMDSSPETGGSHDIAEAKVRYGAVSADWLTAEYENQSSPGTWASMGAWTEQSGGGSDTTIAVTSAQQLTQAQLLSPNQLNNINVIVAESLASAQLINIASTLSVAAVNAEQKTQGNIAAIATINQLTTVITEQKAQSALVASDNNQLISAVQAQQLTQSLQISVTSDGAQDVNVVITEQKTQTQALIVSELSNIKLVICEQIAQSINSAVVVDSSVNAITAEQLANAVTVTVDESSGLFVTVVQTEQLAHASTVNSQVNALVGAVVLEQLTQYNTQQIDIDLTISPVVAQQLTQAELVNIIVSNIAYELNVDIDQVTLEMLTPTYHIELLTPIYIIDQLH